MFRNKLTFYGEELLVPRPTPKLEDHPLSAVHDLLFNVLAVPSITEGHLEHEVTALKFNEQINISF